MDAECYPITTLPHTSALFRDYASVAEAREPALLRRWYPHDAFGMEWAGRATELTAEHRDRLGDALAAQAAQWGAGELALANIERLRAGAAAVVTGQQVGLFGGPLLTLLKAATAIRKAQDATRLSGREHVPVFWLASEDHDLVEVDQVALPGKAAMETLQLGIRADRPVPVGGLSVAQDPARLEAELERASELLAWAPLCDTLRECYRAGETLASAFAKLLTRVFAAHGLVVLDAAGASFHALGGEVLRGAVEHAAELEEALLQRSAQLESAGYHAQVLVSAGHSLLFLLDGETGARVPLRRTAEGGWKAGQRVLSTAELLDIVDTQPERVSPNALLRPVFQDAILPTAAYVGGPAEIAYFAQSAVVYERLLGRVTPVLPRLSATLLPEAVARVMDTHEVTVPQVFEARDAAGLAQRLAARAMPIEAKRKVAAVGNAMDTELQALTAYAEAMSADLGRAAGVSASKMRYQMNRLRRLMANFELQKEASLSKHATAIALTVAPGGVPQERVVGGIWALATFADDLPHMLVEHAGQGCPGHRVIRL